MRYVANPIGYVGMVIGQLLLNLSGFIDIYIQVLSANFFPTLDVKINVYRQTLELKWLLLGFTIAMLHWLPPRRGTEARTNKIKLSVTDDGKLL